MDRETRDMLLETASRFFAERAGKDIVNGVEKGVWPADLWKEIEEMGLPLIAVPEELEGVGGTLADLMAMLRVAGEHAVPVPVAETALANLLISAAGGKPATGPSTLALGDLSLQGNACPARSRACRSPASPSASSRSSRPAASRPWSSCRATRSRSRTRRAMPVSPTAP